MSDKKKKEKNASLQKDRFFNGKNKKKQRKRKSRHNASQFTKEHGNDIEFTETFEKFGG